MGLEIGLPITRRIFFQRNRRAATRSAGRKECSGNQLADDVAVNVSQAEVAAGVTIGQSLVVEPEKTQDRGVQVVHVHLVLDGVPAELVGAPEPDAELEAASALAFEFGMTFSAGAEAPMRGVTAGVGTARELAAVLALPTAK